MNMVANNYFSIFWNNIMLLTSLLLLYVLQ